MNQIKPDDVVRIFSENFHSLKVFGKGKIGKIKRLRVLGKQYDVDLLCGVETKIDWRYAEPDDTFENLFLEDRRGNMQWDIIWQKRRQGIRKG